LKRIFGLNIKLASGVLPPKPSKLGMLTNNGCRQGWQSQMRAMVKPVKNFKIEAGGCHCAD
jgi:hypothetical protein